MPIKLPKGFARRKSSGNALEDVENPPQQSFRVFERPSVENKSFSDGNLVSQRLVGERQSYSPPEEPDNIFAGSEGPSFRNLTGTYDSSSPLRFSSSTRRSTDGPQFDSQSPHSRNLNDIPTPPFSALRAAGRTFSFGGKFSKNVPLPSKPSTPDLPRNRAMTTSTTSTATPPKLLESDFQIDRIGDDFGSMFDNIGKRDTQDLSEKMNSSSFAKSPGVGFRNEEKARPAPIDTDRSKSIEPSPYSWSSSRHSEEGLLNNIASPIASPQEDRSEFPKNSPDSDPAPLGGRRKSLPLSNTMPTIPTTTTSHRSLEKPNLATDKGLRRSVLYSTKRDSAAVEDEDAKLIMESLYSQRNSQAPFTSEMPDSDGENNAPLFSSTTTAKAPPPRHETLSERSEDSPMLRNGNIDASIADHARLAAQYENSQTNLGPSSNKIMTPSQFERYRQQQELKRSNSNASSSQGSEVSEFDEEDEAEKNREAERQRRKQEAHLSVYRQQMMKVTGQKSPSPSLRPELDPASNSAPNLTLPSLNPNSRSASGKSSEGDDDDEIPLGILAAHGFPNRNRPPSRLISSSSNPNLRASMIQPYLSSGDYDSNNRASLPVFARNLPRDPYFGAGLVNPSNRESLALGGGSVHGGPSAAAGPSPALPPGGLIGVIATEERARAMRRGSPNTQAIFDQQPGLSGPGGIPRPYTMLNMNSPNASNFQPAISATEQAQIQLSHQMSNMMQMQMQWMQQMFQMQGGPVPPQQLIPPPGFQPPLIPSATSRPSSMPSSGPVFHNAPSVFAGDQRTLSMLDPNGSSRLNAPALPFVNGGIRPGTPSGAGYAPSIAPSERSNVGLAPRYRPVSTIQPGPEPHTYPPSQPWNDENRRSSILAPSVGSKMTVRPVSSHLKPSTTTNPPGADDENDDEGWAEMMKKREKKRNNWKLKKESSSFGDLLNAVH